MRNLAKLSFALLLTAAAAAPVAACGDDDENFVRFRPEGGTGEASADGSNEASAPGTLSCGEVVPAAYESPMFAENAKGELDLKARFFELQDKMRTAEGNGAAVVTAAELQAISTAGAPSLRSIATAAAQAKVDEYLAAFGAVAVAGGKTWTPADAEAEGGASAGGKYESTNIVSGTGLDLREAAAKTLLGGALYNHALALAGGVITPATIDRLVALFGATPKLANRTDADAGADERDTLIAQYASQRDNKTSQTLGSYRKIRGALLVAKAAANRAADCRTDLDAALRVYFLEWEKATYASAIFSLNAAATSATATPTIRGAQALQFYAEAVGFIQSFKGVPQDRRKITDAQIDALLVRIGVATPYKLVTIADGSARIVAFNAAFQDIGVIYGLTQTEIEDAKKVY